MKKKLYDLAMFCVVFVLLSDIADSEVCYEMGIFRVIIPVMAGIIGSVPFMLAHKAPIDRSWKGIVDAMLDILISGCGFLFMCMMNLWGFIRTDFIPAVNIEGFNFMTTAWIIYFVTALLIRLTLITEKIFHWYERRNIRIKLIE